MCQTTNQLNDASQNGEFQWFHQILPRQPVLPGVHKVQLRGLFLNGPPHPLREVVAFAPGDLGAAWWSGQELLKGTSVKLTKVIYAFRYNDI